MIIEVAPQCISFKFNEIKLVARKILRKEKYSLLDTLNIKILL